MTYAKLVSIPSTLSMFICLHTLLDGVVTNFVVSFETAFGHRHTMHTTFLYYRQHSTMEMISFWTKIIDNNLIWTIKHKLSNVECISKKQFTENTPIAVLV